MSPWQMLFVGFSAAVVSYMLFSMASRPISLKPDCTAYVEITPHNRDELRAEIERALPDDPCNPISLATLRKLLLDMETVTR